VRKITLTAALLAATTLLAVNGVAGASSPRAKTSGSAARFRVCLVTDIGGINDRAFNQLTWQGMLAAQAARPRKISAVYLPSTSSQDYARNIAVFVREKCGLIVTVGFLMGPATEAAAKAHPGRRFAIVDCTYRSFCLTGRRLKNIDALSFNVVQDAFLGGYLAAGMSKTHVVATYGGAQFGTTTIYEDGFWDGIQYFNRHHHRNVKVLGWNEKTQRGIFVGGRNPFGDPAAGARITNRFINSGADIIFPLAGITGLGTAKAVRVADAVGKHVAVEWADTDGCFSLPASYCKFFLTSVNKGISTDVEHIVLEALGGVFPKIYTGTLANGGVALASYHHFARKVPAPLRAELSKVEEAIENGKIVPATKSPV
jgi:basic membrane protein A